MLASVPSRRRLAASREAEEILRGAKPSRELYEQAAKVAAESVDPLTDARYDAAYRRDLTRTMTLRALNAGLLPDMNVDLTVNGERYVVDVEPRCTLADALREKCGKTGTNLGCEHGVCGACTVLVDGEPVRSCLLFAVQLDGKVDPYGRRARAGRSTARAATRLHGASRAAVRVLHAGVPDAGGGATSRRTARSDEEAIRDLVASNLCRCTGYQNIVRAICVAAERLR